MGRRSSAGTCTITKQCIQTCTDSGGLRAEGGVDGLEEADHQGGQAEQDLVREPNQILVVGIFPCAASTKTGNTRPKGKLLTKLLDVLQPEHPLKPDLLVQHDQHQGDHGGNEGEADGRGGPAVKSCAKIR